MILALLLLLCPYLTAQKSPQPATQDEESRMFGRILGAVEDEGGGYLTEALSRLSSIESDLKKREYSARIRWLAHFEHGKTLMAAKKPKQAVQFLEIAQKDAESLTEKEQKETAASLNAALANVH
jgi:hypothetical protein